MSNRHYYKFEADLIAAIMAADPETLRGALAGAVKWCDDANFNRHLHSLLVINSDPVSDLRKSLKSLEIA